jgi:bacillithiol system protein YtxJ
MQKLETTEDWEKVKSEVKTHILIAKLSPICPTSFSAQNVLQSWTAAADLSQCAVFTVDVIAARPLSQAIATEFGITHQSPQAIFIDPDKKAVKDASHYSIDTEWLTDCLNLTTLSP